jgi:hypothetical protein
MRIPVSVTVIKGLKSLKIFKLDHSPYQGPRHTANRQNTSTYFTNAFKFAT